MTVIEDLEMAYLKETLLDEIALEGLDGITVNTLWIRLSQRPNFNFTLDDSTKPYLWKCILGLKPIDFYTLATPRPDLVPYNRFHYIDPESKHFIETDDIPEDIYPVKLAEEEGVLGSCAEYTTRVKVTDDIRTGKPTLEQVMEKYGNTLVIVAWQQTRLRTLIGADNDPDFEFDSLGFALLERIGRSRYMGVASYGCQSLQVFGEQPKTIHYMLKKLRTLKMMRKQRMCVVKKSTKVTCFLYQLNRFYKEIGNRIQSELLNMATYLSKKPDQVEESAKVRHDLKLFNLFKKLRHCTTPSGEKIFDIFDVPMRERYPDARPRDYLNKDQTHEKTVRLVRLMIPLEAVQKSLRDYELYSDDEEDDEDEFEVNPIPDIAYKREYDQPNLYQLLRLINQSGSRGLSQIEIQKLTGGTRLAVRRTIRILQKSDYVTTVMQDRGRQKTIMYVGSENIKDNTIHISVKEEIGKLQDNTKGKVPQDGETEKIEKKSGKTKRKGKPLMDAPVVKFHEEEPSEEKAAEIQKELDRLEETQHIHNISDKHLQAKREVLLDLQQSSGMKIVLEEMIPEPVVDKKSGQQLVGMKRFGNLITESHIRRLNWILEVVSAIKVVESFRLCKLIRNREKEMNMVHSMDNKSLKRLIWALHEEQRVRSYKAFITVGARTKEVTYVCQWGVTQQDENLFRMIDEAKLRYFSVSKEDLKLKSLALKADKKKKESGKQKIPEVGDSVPETVIKALVSRQEYRKKLANQMPVMKYNRNAGKKYGLLPKMTRIQVAHQLLFYLCYDMHGNEIKNPRSQGPEPEQPESSKEVRTTADGQDKILTDVEEGMPDPDFEPPVYVNELTWQRYLPPVPAHTGYPKGWCLISDILLNLPVYLFCQIINVTYDIAGLEETLKHPKKRLFPVIHLPFKLTQQLLHSKKYVHNFFELCAYLAEMGLLSFGREVLKEKEQTFIFLHQNASLLDTKESLKGYNKTRSPNGQPFPERHFRFEELADLDPYWEFVQVISVNSNLGHKSMVKQDIDDEETLEVRSLKEAGAPYRPDTVEDKGILPGDRRGAAGLDSSLFVHSLKNWRMSRVPKPRIYKRYDPFGDDDNVMEKEMRTETADALKAKGKDRLVLSDSPDQPLALKKVVRGAHGNRGGKGIPKLPGTRPAGTQTHLSSTTRVLLKAKGRLLKRRKIKIMNKKVPKKTLIKGDEKDRHIYLQRHKQRVIWTMKEDTVVLMCRLATLIMDERKKISLVSYPTFRDYLHEKCGKISYDKTSCGIQRRISFVLKNPQTETNLLMYYREALQDEFVLKNYVGKNFVVTDTNLKSDFRILVDYLLDKFKSLDLQKCSLPKDLTELRKNYVVQFVGKLKAAKIYQDVRNKSDICADVLRNILHSAVLLHDKQARTHEMFKLLNQYPESILSSVVRELRNDGMFVINKKHYAKETMNQLETGMGLRNFKVSQRYLYHYKHRYLSEMFEECAQLLHNLWDHYLQSEGQETAVPMPFQPTGGECALLFPLLLNRMLDFKITMPDELVTIDMTGFYDFPWGRGKKKFIRDRIAKQTGSKQTSESAVSGETMDYDDDSEDELPPLSSKTSSLGKKSASDGTREEKGQEKDTNSSESHGTSIDVAASGDSGSKSTSESDNREASSSAAESVSMEGFTHVRTKCSHVVVPPAALFPEQPAEDCPPASVASRTLLSLMRSENLSTDDIRIFNAQDNFVLKSCGIDLALRESDACGSVQIEVKKSPLDKLEEENAGETGPQLSNEERRQQFSHLFLDKTKVKNLCAELQKLLPFHLDMENVWKEMKAQGSTDEELTIYQDVYQYIDSHSEVGVRHFDIQRHFSERKNFPWKEAVEILMRQSAVLKVGVTCTRYVTLNNARPWVIHAYRNIRGRGLHVDEERSNSLPIDKADDLVEDSQAVVADPPSYFYTEKVTTDTPGSSGVSSLSTKKEKTDPVDHLQRISEKTRGKKRPAEDSQLEENKKRKLSDDLEVSQSSVVLADTDEHKETLDSEKEASSEKLTENLSHTKKVPDETGSEEVVTADESVSVRNETEDITSERQSKDTQTAYDENVESLEGKESRKLRKRKHPGEDNSQVGKDTTAISTYDKVRLVIQPWRKPEGGINRPILKMMMESILLYLMMNPGCKEEAICQRYSPYLQPMVIRNIVDILEDIGCVTRLGMKKQTSTLFSKPTFPEFGSAEEEDYTVILIPAEYCVLRMGQFGQEVFPNAKWPETSTKLWESTKYVSAQEAEKTSGGD